MNQLLTLSFILFSFFNSFSQKPEIVFETPEYNFGDIQENKGFIHIRYVIPLLSFELETFGQVELDNFRSLLNRNLLGMGLRYTLQSTKLDNLNYGIGMMYEHEKYDGSSILKSDSIKSTNEKDKAKRSV